MLSSTRETAGKAGHHLRPVFSLYRSYLREIRQLPQTYLQHFFRLKVTYDFRAVLRTSNETLSSKKIKKVSKDLRSLHAANQGNLTAFRSVLDIAYGRKGPLWWELMKLLLSDPSSPRSPPIITGNERSRPPACSPQLAALLTSTLSRRTKPLSPNDLKSPPILQDRAKLSSKQVFFLGPFSKRREVNIRWRYFVREWKKVLPPLQIHVNDFPGIQDGPADASLNIGFEKTDVFWELSKLAGQPWKSPTTKKELCAFRRHDIKHKGITKDKTVGPRWLRRRYQELLGKLPILMQINISGESGQNARYEIALPSNALFPSRSHSARFPHASEENMDWIRRAQGKSTSGHGKRAIQLDKTLP